ncbi:hypothetical protein FHS20_001300 [Phyllobacterium endophyticum]|nr:hypothetical protein [Phyllobacterium endophyticum]
MTEKPGQVVRLEAFRPEYRFALRFRFRVWWDFKFLPLLDRLKTIENQPQARRRGFRLCHRKGLPTRGPRSGSST